MKIEAYVRLLSSISIFPTEHTDFQSSSLLPPWFENQVAPFLVFSALLLLQHRTDQLCFFLVF